MNISSRNLGLKFFSESMLMSSEDKAQVWGSTRSSTLYLTPVCLTYLTPVLDIDPDLTDMSHFSWQHCAGIEGISPLLLDVWALVLLFGMWVVLSRAHCIASLFTALQDHPDSRCEEYSAQYPAQYPTTALLATSHDILWGMMAFCPMSQLFWGCSCWEGPLSNYRNHLSNIKRGS